MSESASLSTEALVSETASTGLTCAECGSTFERKTSEVVCGPGCRKIRLARQHGESDRRWRASQPKKVRRSHERWAKANPDKVAAARRRQQPKLTAKRKEIRGRVCVSCSRGDDVVAWSLMPDYCGPCEKRGHRNDFCPGCRAARYGTGRGSGFRARCLCPKAQKRAASRRLLLGALVGAATPSVVTAEADMLLRLWDAIRWRDPMEATGAEFAEFLCRDVRVLCPGRFARLESVIKRLDPAVVVERDKPRPVVIRWTGRLVGELERLADDLALAVSKPTAEQQVEEAIA